MAEFDWDKPQEKPAQNIPDWDKEGPGKSIAKRPGDPSFAQQMGGLAYGAGTQILGAPGEIQEFFTTSGKGEKLFGPESPISIPNLPTAGEIRKGLKGSAIEPEPKTKFMQKTGEVLADVGMAAPMGARTVGTMVGSTTKEGERIAGIAERLGFRLSPSQVRADSPVAEKGAVFNAKHNQTLANRLASNGTGKAVDEITEPFLRGRIKDLGSEFDKVYKGKVFKIDPSVEPHLENILAREQELGFAGVSAVKGAAQSILDNIATGQVKGDDIQRLRNALTQAARSAGSRGKSHEIYELVDVLDKAVENSNPAMKATLATIRPQYRNTVILEDLYNSGGIKQGNISLERLGNQVGDSAQLRRNPQDIDNLGMLGSQLGLRARWESAGEDMPGIVKGAVRTHGILPEVVRGLSVPLRSRPARAAQRYANRPAGATQRLGEALGATPAIEGMIRPSDKK
jgi:hypothetical protein